MNTDWNLHILRVVVDDTQVFQIGDVFDWEVNFWFEEILSRSLEKRRTAQAIEKSYYQVNAEVVYISRKGEELCILDFGIMAASETGTLVRTPLPPNCKEGDYVCGRIRLELPLGSEPHSCQIRRKWRVNRVTADFANFGYYPGDLGANDYRDASGTELVKAGSYILNCSDLGLVNRAGGPHMS